VKYNKLIFELSSEGRTGYRFGETEIDSKNILNTIPKNLLREDELNLPQVSEGQVVRHYTNLSNKNYGVDTGMYPLGSCTMKYNPKINEKMAGEVVDAGKDFIILKTKVLNLLLVPFSRILHFTRRCEENKCEELELINMKPCFKRELTLHFGEVVSKSPFLINLFFGLDLHYFLDSYTGCYIYIRTDQDKREIEGILNSTTKNSLVLCMDKEKRGIDFDEILTIEIEQEALARMHL